MNEGGKVVLLIGGHQRSGTTMLCHLCNSHPDITVTREFGNFLALGQSYRAYSRQIMKSWWNVRHRWAFDSTSSSSRWKDLANLLFVVRYLSRVYQERSGHIDIATVEVALRTLFPQARIVGDKWPDFIFLLNNFVGRENVSLLIIYRDCRDVVSSTLEQARTDWRRLPFARQVNTAEKAAQRWVKAIEEMERYRNNLFILRYEDLIHETKRELERLGKWLQVDPQGFTGKLAHNTSIGKHRRGLSKNELGTVLDIASPTMARLGYL